MEKYAKAFRLLNGQQRQAVEQIDGPVLVIAGPGTGKTQLLSTRIGYILEKTDALPQNILALTFTEAGVDAMRERLTDFLGQDAYAVNISTYHAFGAELIRRYPEYTGTYDYQMTDDVTADYLIRQILEALPYSNPLRRAETYATDLRAFISDAKRAMLDPEDIISITKNNLSFIKAATEVVRRDLAGLTRMGKTAAALFSKLQTGLHGIDCGLNPPVASLKSICLDELAAALASDDSKQLTKWKNDWLEKDGEGRFVFGGQRANRRIEAAAEIYAAYRQQLTEQKLFDYDDMILRAIQALEDNPDFKFTLAEQYLYILLDEFQDTNAAQLRLVELLSDNPVNEGRPNILAVGDDDQAIYAFQGAQLANMSRFVGLYRDVHVIPLTENYRSSQPILEVAESISGQIVARLHEQFPGIDKTLRARTRLKAPPKVEKHDFISDAAQYQWLAERIRQLVDNGVAPAEIAVLAPKHRYLIPLLPYLADKTLPVRYEKRENVILKPINQILIRMSELTLALADGNERLINALWPEVLSYDFWHLTTERIWQVSWRAATENGSWTGVLLENEHTKPIALFFLRLKDLLSETNLEQQLDILIGSKVDDQETYSLPIRSPLYSHYFGSPQRDADFIETLSDLAVLRGRLRDWRRDLVRPLGLADFVEFINAHIRSGINILNTSPHYEAADAVNIMTAYQAKGREFQAVFIVAAMDEVWGSASKNPGSIISLPANLKFMRYRGASDDERLRLLYVAMTRAKKQLYLTGYAKTLDGKGLRPLKYLNGSEDMYLNVSHDEDALNLEAYQAYWNNRHTPPFEPRLKELLAPRLERYQMSPTHLNQFTDLIWGGPEQFFLNTVLRFPKASPPPAQFGTVIHDSLRWAHDSLVRDGSLPTPRRLLNFFDQRLAARRLPEADFRLLRERGHRALKLYMADGGAGFDATDIYEHSFRGEGVFVGAAHLSGKIDRLRFDKKNKLITVYDFKTGPSYDKWAAGNATLHKYRQQLLMYKLLVEKSHTWSGWKVEKAVLEFIEPPADDDTIYQLEMRFKADELMRLEKLIQAVWQRVQALDFPATSRYPANMGGINAFEDDLIA